MINELQFKRTSLTIVQCFLCNIVHFFRGLFVFYLFIFFHLYICRVNKKWKSLLTCQSVLWTRVIIPPLGYAYNAETRFRSGLLKFMKPRFGPKLVYLDISVMNAASLRFLDQKCPNLFSLSMCVENPSLDISIIPSRLTFLELRVGTGNGHARQDWWMCVTCENFANLEEFVSYCWNDNATRENGCKSRGCIWNIFQANQQVWRPAVSEAFHHVEPYLHETYNCPEKTTTYC